MDGSRKIAGETRSQTRRIQAERAHALIFNSPAAFNIKIIGHLTTHVGLSSGKNIYRPGAEGADARLRNAPLKNVGAARVGIGGGSIAAAIELAVGTRHDHRDGRAAVVGNN